MSKLCHLYYILCTKNPILHIRVWKLHNNTCILTLYHCLNMIAWTHLDLSGNYFTIRACILTAYALAQIIFIICFIHLIIILVLSRTRRVYTFYTHIYTMYIIKASSPEPCILVKINCFNQGRAYKNKMYAEASVCASCRPLFRNNVWKSTHTHIVYQIGIVCYTIIKWEKWKIMLGAKWGGFGYG